MSVRVFVCGAALFVAALVALAGCYESVGESCTTTGTRRGSNTCSPGLFCIDEVCMSSQACDHDSDCPHGMACSLRDDYGVLDCELRCTVGTNAGCATGYACAADGRHCEPRTGLRCYVGDDCGRGAACSAVTRVCTPLPPCSAVPADPACGPYACASYRCQVSCAADADCAPGYACDRVTFACTSVAGRGCDPTSEEPGQCGFGAACSPASSTCERAVPCGQGCGDYGCNPDGFCNLGCTANALACAIGKACDLATHTCGR